jgi:branched-chain amino acid transport system substrate-binding protein
VFKKKNFSIFLALILIFAVFAAGCGGNKDKEPQEPAQGAEDVIKIGVYEPLTGGQAAGGKMTVDGMKLANKLYPTVLGKKVELVVEDNKSEPTESANVVSRLIDQHKVQVILGSYGSSNSKSGGNVAKTKGVPAIGCSPTNPTVTQDNDYYFRVCFIDPFQGTVMATYAYNDLQAKKVAIIREVTSDYSVGLTNYFIEAFKKLTGDENSIVATLEYKKGDQDFTAQLQTIKNKKPDVIFAPGEIGDSAILIKQARQLKIDVPFLGGDTWEAPEFIQIGGEAVEGIAFSTHYTAEAPVTEMSTTFVDKFQAEYAGQEANAFAALGFDTYILALDAIEKAGKYEAQAIRDVLATTKDFKGATGNITFDENGDPIKSAVIKQVKDGKFVFLTTVEPK